MATKVLIDVNVLSFSATQSLSFIPVNKEIKDSAGEVIGMQVSEVGYVNKNSKLSEGEELKIETDLLPRVAELAKEGELEVLQHLETIIEGAGLPKMASASGKFYGAPMTMAESPIQYGRVLFSGKTSSSEHALDFLKAIDDQRFKTLQKITNADPSSKKYLNQLRDAFYIWCAEHNNCDYLLTLDFKLINMVNNNKQYTTQVKVVKPSILLAEIGASGQ